MQGTKLINMRDSKSDTHITDACEEKMKPWQELERWVQYVYDTLLNIKDEGILVARDVRLKGRDDIEHQIGVFYEFSRAGIIHRVAIECKNAGRPIVKDMVMAFKAKISDIQNIQGVIVAANGFQSGAKNFASKNGIIALELKDLPSLPMLVGYRLESVALPDEKCIGEPFWTLYECQDGSNTGTLYAMKTKDGSGFGILFFSRRQAETFLKTRDDSGNLCVIGLPQRCLRSFILTVDLCRGRFMILDEVKELLGPNSWKGIEIPRKKLIEDFYVGSIPIPEEPLVMSSHRR